MRIIILLLAAIACQCQLAAAQKRGADGYRKMKAEQLAGPSPYQNIIDGKDSSVVIIYENKDVIAFTPSKAEAPIHYIIAAKKRISSVNELTDKDLALAGKLLLAGRDIAKQLGLDESGYRLVINTNRQAGQSVFHLHMDLLAGAFLGKMCDEVLEDNEVQSILK